MNSFKKIVSILISATWLYVLQTQFKVGENELPPLGKFFSPSVGFWQNVLHPDTRIENSLDKKFASGKAVFDKRMVPHIFASSLEDAYFIQGYVHALHRLWQMDFTTRAAEGRISEIIGEKAIEFDRHKRRLGLKESAKASVEHWKKFPDSYRLIQSYSNGFNAYLNSLPDARLPVEFKLMNYKPEPWSPYRSSLFHKSMAEILCGRESDVELTNAKAFYGDDFAILFNEMDSLTDPVIPKGTTWSFSKPKSFPKTDTAEWGYIDWIREPGPSGIGSNNWAVGPSKSVSGNPILCNDPHLFLTLPSVWYEQQIITPEVNVYGVTFPGIPGVLIGFNKDICWGVTNAAWDVLDWYQIKWKDESKSNYELDGQWLETGKRIEVINVKGKNDFIDTIKITKWGPVVFEQEFHKKRDLAMHWIIHDPNDYFEFATFADLNKAKNYSDYRSAIKQFPYPAQNFAFACTNGDIAMTVQGNMPVKSDQQGRFILDGSSSKNGWLGFLDISENPHCFNPSRGFVSSANQRSTDLSFPNYYNNGDFRDYRGFIINRMLAQKEKWSIEDMKALQYNSTSLRAETSLPFMLNSLDTSQLNHSAKQIYQVLKNWDYSYDSSSIAPAYFEHWFEIFHRMCWDEIFQDPNKKAVAVPSDQSTINFMKSNPAHVYFDLKNTASNENAVQLLQLSLDSLVKDTSLLGRVQDWADYKDAQIVHMSRIPAFGRYHLRTSGTKDVINAHGKTEGPSWRMIVELGKEKITALGIYPGGQSGNPGSPYYTNMIDDWSRGQYDTLHYLSKFPEDPGQYKILNFGK